MSAHTNTPWVAVEGIIYPSNGREDGEDWIADLRCAGNTDANERRIVACVNACVGLSTAMLENIALTGGIVERFALLSQTEHQRDELLAAARNLRDVKGRHHSEQAFARLVEAVAKVEGKA